MTDADKDKLDVINAILPVMAELRRFYRIQSTEGRKLLENWKGESEHYGQLLKTILEETEKTSQKLHALSGISWCLIDQVCESLGFTYHEYVKDGQGD